MIDPKMFAGLILLICSVIVVSLSIGFRIGYRDGFRQGANNERLARSVKDNEDAARWYVDYARRKGV